MSNDMIPTTPEQKTWGMAIHLAALIGVLLPLGLVLGPMLVWMLKKNDAAYFDTQGKKAVNFQLTILIAAFIFALLSLLIRPFISFAFMAGIAGLVFAIIAGINTKNGKEYNYPFSFRFVK